MLTRRFLMSMVLVFALVALGVSIWTAAHASAYGRYHPHPPPTTTTTTTTTTTVPVTSADKITGMSDPDLIVVESAATQVSQLADMKNHLHVTSVRIDANWGYWENTQGVFNWGPLDQTVALIRAEGMSIDFIIDGVPAWAALVPSDVNANGDNALPANPAQFGAWAQAVASRYGSGGLTSYEIENEENDGVLPAPNPVVYTADLKAAYVAIKAVQPNEDVITGGLAAVADSAYSIAPIEFLQDVYADGGAGYFNAVGDHTYSQPALPNELEAWSGFSEMSATSPSIRSVMVANGDANMQVWITEVGYPSNVTSLAGISGSTAESDELTQLNAFAAANTWVGPIYWYTYQDDASGPFGVVTLSGAHKSAWTTMAGL